MGSNGTKLTVAGYLVRLPKYHTRKLLGDRKSTKQLWADGDGGFVSAKKDAEVFSTIEGAVVNGIHNFRSGFKVLNAIWRAGARPEAVMVEPY